MKNYILTTLILSGLSISCGENKADSNKTASATKSSEKSTESKSPGNETLITTDGSNGLIGTWQLQLDAYDDNENGLLDPIEREKATPNRTSYQFKPDGSCVIQGIFKGRYELKEENGKDNLIVYRERIPQEEDKDPDPDHFRILTMTANELVLLMQESHNSNTIWIFKRAG